MHRIKSPARGETGPQRGLVIAVDGRCSTLEMQGLARAMRLGPAAADLLQRHGEIELPRGTPVRPAPAGDSAGRAAPRADARTEAQARALSELTCYALELAFLMLAGRADDTLALGSAIRTRAALLDWCARCTEDIARLCGAAQAQEFRSMVAGALQARG